MRNTIRLFSLLIVPFTLFLLSACSSGGGDDGSPAPLNPNPAPKTNTITGIITAPGGSIASLQHQTLFAQFSDFMIPNVAADITGTAPVANATVELIQVDADGMQVGGTVESTTTNASGEFTINTTLNFSTNLMLRVGTSPDPQLRAFVTGETTNINPATEYVVGKIIASIQAQAGVDMSNFSIQEIAGFIQAINNQNIDLTGNDIDTALNTIETSVGSTIDSMIVAAIGSIDTLAVKVFIDLEDQINTVVTVNDTNYQSTVTLLQNGVSQTATTDASGIAAFQNVSSDPVTITAQYDFIFGDVTVRGAASVHDLQPVNGEAGIFIFSDYEPEDNFIAPVTGTSISGTISNIPQLPPDYNLGVNIVPVNACCGGGTPVTITSGQTSATYSVTNDNLLGNQNLGSGEYLLYAEISKWTDNVTLTFSRDYSVVAIFPTVVTATAGSDTPNINIDFNNAATRIEFVSKDITINNFNPTGFMQQSEFDINSVVEIPGLGDFDFNTFTNNSLQGPKPYQLPPSVTLVSSAPGNASVFYDVYAEGDAKLWEAKLPMNTETSLTIDMLTPPVIITPNDEQTMSKQQAENLQSQWQNPNSQAFSFNIAVVATPEGGLNESGLPDADLIYWVHFIKADATTMNLPPLTQTALPMIAAGANYFYYHQFEKTDQNFDFDAVFNFDIANTINGTLDPGESLGAARSVLFSTSP